jgi:hypothetical protein
MDEICFPWFGKTIANNAKSFPKNKKRRKSGYNFLLNILAIIINSLNLTNNRRKLAGLSKCHGFPGKKTKQTQCAYLIFGVRHL